MSPDAVAIGLDIFKDFLLRLISGEQCVLIDQFGLDGFEKRLGHRRIIPAVCFAAHALMLNRDDQALPRNRIP